MKFEKIEFTSHAIQQMFLRKIVPDEIKSGVKDGEIIKTYPDDKHYPSYLILHYINGRPLHRDQSVIIIKNVPASVCENCGEYCLSDEVTKEIMERAERAVANNVEVEVLQYAA